MKRKIDDFEILADHASKIEAIKWTLNICSFAFRISRNVLSINLNACQTLVSYILMDIILDIWELSNVIEYNLLERKKYELIRRIS